MVYNSWMIIPRWWGVLQKNHNPSHISDNLRPSLKQSGHRQFKILTSNNGDNVIRMSLTTFAKRKALKGSSQLGAHINKMALQKERATIVGVACNMLQRKNLPSQFGWSSNTGVMVSILNCYPMKVMLNKRSYEAWFKRKPKVTHLWGFECITCKCIPKRIGKGYMIKENKSSSLAMAMNLRRIVSQIEEIKS